VASVALGVVRARISTWDGSSMGVGGGPCCVSARRSERCSVLRAGADVSGAQPARSAAPISRAPAVTASDGRRKLTMRTPIVLGRFLTIDLSLIEYCDNRH